ncbi:MAG TPA: cytochrome P460 family protein [Steroidobacteraceae bacterium]|nr:cytochrome P460 family protein [Steroidobacteraceae bacterium]
MSGRTLRPIMFMLALLPWAAHAQTPAASAGPVYTAAGELVPPTQYREWIYLSTGMNMSYLKRVAGMGHDMFSNVFVNPQAYREFQKTGTWPDKTMLVLEVRGATNKGSINKQGFYQSSNIMGLEVHVKDAHFQGGWAFFADNGGKPAKQIPYTADCYSCHKDHAAVDTTFVQFYPTLLDLAKKKGTLSPQYLAEQAQAPK